MESSEEGGREERGWLKTRGRSWGRWERDIEQSTGNGRSSSLMMKGWVYYLIFSFGVWTFLPHWDCSFVINFDREKCYSCLQLHSTIIYCGSVLFHYYYYTCTWRCIMQGAQSDSEEESVTSDLKDLEFKLLHDLSQLQVYTCSVCDCKLLLGFLIITCMTWFDIIHVFSHCRKLLMLDVASL